MRSAAKQSNKKQSSKQPSDTELHRVYHRVSQREGKHFWRFALMKEAPVKAPCAQRHLRPLCETLWHTLCNSVSDGYLLDCFLLDCFAAVRTSPPTSIGIAASGIE